MTMSGDHSKRGRGLGWIVLILIPPVAVVIGLVAVFIWQGSKGGITPKWKKKPASAETNAVVPRVP